MGGIIPPKDEKKLLSFGVKAVFTPKDFRIEEIMKQITDILKKHMGKKSSRISY